MVARRTILVATAILFLMGTGCLGQGNHGRPSEIPAGDSTFQLSTGDLDREYIVHVPELYDEDHPAAVVIMFHGGGGTAKGVMAETGWAEKADQAGFLAVFPEGSRPDANNPASFSRNPQTWNDGSGRDNVGAVQRNVDDVGFVTALLSDLADRFNVDPNRIYAAGFSNGAAMVFRLGRELSSSLAAIACVASADWLVEPHIQYPVSMIYITGTDDPLNPIDGGEIFIGRTSYGVKHPVQQTILKWVQMLGCPADSSVALDDDGVRIISFKPCTEGSEVVSFTIAGMGHWWPGWSPPESTPRWLLNILGKPSDKIQGTDVIWDFFQAYQKP